MLSSMLLYRQFDVIIQPLSEPVHVFHPLSPRFLFLKWYLSRQRVANICFIFLSNPLFGLPFFTKRNPSKFILRGAPTVSYSIFSQLFRISKTRPRDGISAVSGSLLLWGVWTTAAETFGNATHYSRLSVHAPATSKGCPLAEASRSRDARGRSPSCGSEAIEPLIKALTFLMPIEAKIIPSPRPKGHILWYFEDCLQNMALSFCPSCPEQVEKAMLWAVFWVVCRKEI